MSTPIVEEKTPSDEEPASKKLRLEDELFSNVENEVEDPCDDSLQQLQDDACTQNESNEASTQVYVVSPKLYLNLPTCTS